MGRQSVGYLLWDVTRMLRRRFQDDKQYTNLTFSQSKALALIHHHEGIKQVELAEMLDIKPMSLLRNIDALINQGLIERRPDPNDRRAHQIFLTPKATPQLEKIKSVTDNLWDEVLDGLSDEDIERFTHILSKIQSNLV